MADIDFYLAWRGIAILIKNLMQGLVDKNRLTRDELIDLEERLNEISEQIKKANTKKDKIAS